MQQGHVVIAAVGLAFEARIAAGPGVVVLGRAVPGGLAASAERAIRSGARGIVSFGIAGGLDPRLHTGSWVVASQVTDSNGETWQTCPAWSARVLQALPNAIHAPMAGSEGPVAHPAIKRLMHQKLGAVAVDMESHIAAQAAKAHGVPFVIIRVICDPAHRALPTAALAGMRPDGRTHAVGVVKALAGRPSSLGGVLRTAVDAAGARAALERGRRALGASYRLLEEVAIPQPQPAALPELRAAGSQPF